LARNCLDIQISDRGIIAQYQLLQSNLPKLEPFSVRVEKGWSECQSFPMLAQARIKLQ
jgi:hypothetical protein